jgi:hypothetical protein
VACDRVSVVQPEPERKRSKSSEKPTKLPDPFAFFGLLGSKPAGTIHGYA